ncbi:MAG: outer membrane protein assembly factor BamD [Nitrospirae bacterium]|nr:outer membrane protein assembly factor BamD [Nitrospirota bacterium]
MNIKWFKILIVITALCFMSAAIVSCSNKKVKAPYNTEEYYKEALELVAKKDYKEARELLTEVKNRDITKEYAPLAQIKIAETYALDEEPELAIEEYREFLRLFPSHKNAVYCQFQIACTYFDQIEGQDREYFAAGKAIDEFKKLEQLYPRNPYSDIIRIRVSQCRNVLASHEEYVGFFYYKKGSYDSAINRFKYIINKYPDYERIQHVYYYTGLSYLEKESPAEAKEYLKKAAELSTDTKITDKARNELKSLKN